MGQNLKLPTIFAAGLAGILTAHAISATLYSKDLNSLFEWTITLVLLALGFGALFFMLLPIAWEKFRDVPAAIKFWGATLAIASAAFFSSSLGVGFLIPFILAGLILTSFTLTSLHEIFNENRAVRLISAWVLGGLVSFFALGFFKNFHPAFLEFLLFTVLFSSILTVLFEKVLEQIIRALKSDPMEKIVSMAVLTLGLVSIVLTARLLVAFPYFFTSDFFLPAPHLIPAFFGTIILAQGLAAFILQQSDSYHWQASPFFVWMKRNLPGLLLASTISASAYLLATALVSSDIGFLDMFFQIDSPFWVNFLTLEADKIMTMRSVHPFVLLILRPLVWLISLFLNGDRFHAALLLNTIFAGVSVFLAWLFFKKRTGNTAYALLIAALLGFSNSHLVLGSFLESYIFSAAALISFIMLVQSKEGKFPHIVLAGLVTFGITITNFIQTCIALLLIRRDTKLIFKYVFIVLVLAVLLAFVQNVFYPTSDPFYVPNTFKTETVNIDTYLDLEPDLARKVLLSRMNVTFRNITLFSMVAPRPLVRYEETNCSPLCFRVMKYFRGEYLFASYVGLGSWLTRIWFLGLIIASLIFAWRLFKSPNQVFLQTALLLNIIFNFVLHIKYGDDPLLYTPNWTYALVFFFGISFEPLANRKWWQALLLIFLAGLLINNLDLFRKLFETILPYFS